MSNDKTIVLEAEPDFEEEVGNLSIRKSQIITDSLVTDLKDARHNSQHAREGEFMHIAAIPTIIVEQWLREGFDIFAKGVTARDIVARLKQQNLTAFLATNKRV